jgi:phospholipase/carboxylesterase
MVIFLHGYGSNRFDLFELRGDLEGNGKNTYFVSLEAPYQCENFPNGSQWFSLKHTPFPIQSVDALTKTAAESITKDIGKSSQQLAEFIHGKVKETKIPYDKIFLMGFSQGATISIYTSLRMKERLGGIISCSGVVVDGEEFFFGGNFTKQNILFFYGLRDDRIDKKNFASAVTLLKKYLDRDAEIMEYKDLTHAIDSREMEKIKTFIGNEGK